VSDSRHDRPGVSASPTAPASTLVERFDHWDPALAADPHPVYAALRASSPVAWSPCHGGYWVVTGFEAVSSAARQPECFSSTLGSIPEEIGLGGIPLPPLTVDPPDHTRYRQLLLPYFSPKRAQVLRPFARQVAAELVDDAVGRGRFDAASMLAFTLPTRVMGAILGVPSTDEERFARWIHAIVEHGATAREEAFAAGMEASAYFAELLAERGARPTDDLVSLLAGAKVSGRLAPEEALGCCILLLIAGIDTTWSTLGAAVAFLASDADAQAHLRAAVRASGLSASAVEELLRLFAPTSVARRVEQPAALAGQPLSPGDQVLLVFPAANRDPEVFEAPDEPRFDRAPNRHLAFGEGIHKCLGIHFARMELTVALEELLGRAPGFVLDGDVTWKPGPIRGPLSVPVRFLEDSARRPG
jgi:cytochrome P450